MRADEAAVDGKERADKVRLTASGFRASHDDCSKGDISEYMCPMK